jgi:hypothetical protein
MFSMSLKSVPLCLVSIAPMLIGVPVAWTPGLVPQAEVLTVLPLELPDADAEELPDADAEELEPELELELLQAARTPSARAASVASAIRERRPGCLFMCSAFSWLTAKYSSERTRDVAYNNAAVPGEG